MNELRNFECFVHANRLPSLFGLRAGVDVFIKQHGSIGIVRLLRVAESLKTAGASEIRFSGPEAIVIPFVLNVGSLIPAVGFEEVARGLFGLPGVPVYDGVRLFLHVFPFVACLAGVGGVSAARWLRSRGVSERWTLPAVLAVAIVQLVPTAGTIPFGLSYYNLLAGGPAGAERLGFETTYWGEGMDAVFWQEVEKTLPKGSRLAMNFIPADWLRPFYDAPVRRAGLVPVPYRPSPGEPPAWDFLLVVCRKGYFDDEVRRLHREEKPIVERRLRFFGSVPLCRVYDMRGQKGTAGTGG